MIKRIVFAFLIFISFCHAQKLTRNTLPKINIEAIDENSYEADKLNVKLSQSTLQIILQNQQNPIAYLQNNLEPIFEKYNVLSIEYLFKKALQDEVKNDLHIKSGLHLWFHITTKNNASLKPFINELIKSNLFEVVEPVYKKSLQTAIKNIKLITNDPSFKDQWNFKNLGQENGRVGSDIKLNDAWDMETGNPKVIVSIHDMGVMLTHPDLQQNLLPNKHYNFISNSDTIVPGFHGTYMAGIIGAVNNNNIGISGIAGGNGNANSGVRMMSCQVYDLTPNGWQSGGFAESFIYAADNGACISQNSWAYDYVGTYELSVLDAIDYFIDNAGGNVLQGGLVVFASGNKNTNTLVMPSAYDKVIAVAATNNVDEKADYSTFGKWVDIAAPGGEWRAGGLTRILTTTVGGGYGVDHGTSLSCPHVSGVAALIVSKLLGKASASDVKEIILSTADDIYTINPSFKGLLGTGRLNAFKTLQKAQILLQNNAQNSVDSFTVKFNCSKINLTWKKNNINNNVVIFYSNKNDIGIPKNGTQYSIGNSFTGSSKVLYIGNANNFSLNNNDSLLHFFKVYNVDNNNNYSLGISKEMVGLSSINKSGKFEQNFDFPFLQPTKEWRTINTNNDIGWIHTVQDTANTGAGDLYSMSMYNYGLNKNLGSSSTLLTPIIKTQNADSLQLSFWYAYQYRNVSFNMVDTLEVLISSNCGNTYQSLWKQYGQSLSTTGTTNVDTAFYPFGGLSKWKKISLDCTRFKSNERLLFAFKANNGRGNNLFLDNINIENLFSNDIALIDIVSLKKTDCDREINPIIIIKNNGIKDVSNCTINYQIDNGNIINTTWNRNLKTSDTAVVSLKSSIVNFGNHSIKVVTNLNNDTYKSNDSLVKDFIVTKQTENSISENFEEQTNSFNNWIITKNTTGDFAWMINENAGMQSSKSLFIQNNFNSNINTVDDAISPAFYCNRNYDSVFMSFHYAYAVRLLNDSTVLDTLQIDATKDCGNSWKTLWKSQGQDLASYKQSIGMYYNFTPVDSQWKTMKLLVGTNYKTGEIVRTRFRNINRYGNNVYIDNYKLWATISPKDLEQKGYLIYPNPVKNNLYIQHKNQPINLQKIEISNTQGRLISILNYNGNASSDFNVNTSNLASGVYFLKLIYTDKTIIEKLVKIN